MQVRKRHCWQSTLFRGSLDSRSSWVQILCSSLRIDLPAMPRGTVLGTCSSRGNPFFRPLPPSSLPPTDGFAAHPATPPHPRALHKVFDSPRSELPKVQRKDRGYQNDRWRFPVLLFDVWLLLPAFSDFEMMRRVPSRREDVNEAATDEAKRCLRGHVLSVLTARTPRGRQNVNRLRGKVAPNPYASTRHVEHQLPQTTRRT